MDKYDLRLCFEIGKTGNELQKRAQYMVHAPGVRKTKQFADTVKMFDPEKFDALKNQDQRYFCGNIDGDSNLFMADAPDWELSGFNFGTGITSVDIQRPIDDF